MAFETKVILSLLARHIAKADNLEEAYEAVVDAANVEGLDLPSYDTMVAKVKKEKKKNNVE